MINGIKAFLLYLLPHHALSRIVHWLARSHYLPMRKQITHWFIRRYHVDMSEALMQDPDAYYSFNDFFTRALHLEARPVIEEAGLISCPSDGTISQLGDIQDTRILQAKGHNYSLIELLGGSEERAQPFLGGKFSTTYLSPGDYHRVHMPLSGKLMETVYIPGRLFSVSPGYTEAVPNLFARNERVACIFQTDVGPMAVVLVGAIFVGSIETVWAGEITPTHNKRISVTDHASAEPIIELKKGEELGRFNLGGSTIIVLFGPERVQWEPRLGPGSKVRFGHKMGTLEKATR